MIPFLLTFLQIPVRTKENVKQKSLSFWVNKCEKKRYRHLNGYETRPDCPNEVSGLFNLKRIEEMPSSYHGEAICEAELSGQYVAF
jgi:hypothetical protein